MAGTVDPFRAQRGVCLQAPAPGAKVSKLCSLSSHTEGGTWISEASKRVLDGSRIQRVQPPVEVRGKLHLINIQAVAVRKPHDSISAAKTQILIASNTMCVIPVGIVVNAASIIQQDGLAGGTGHAGQITHTRYSRKPRNGGLRQIAYVVAESQGPIARNKALRQQKVLKDPRTGGGTTNRPHVAAGIGDTLRFVFASVRVLKLARCHAAIYRGLTAAVNLHGLRVAEIVDEPGVRAGSRGRDLRSCSDA